MAARPSGGRAHNRFASPVVAGHDPLLEWAVRDSGSELALLFDGSLAGLERLAQRRTVASGLHVIDSDTKKVRARLPREPVVVLEWAWREQGLIVVAGKPLGIERLADLDRVRFAARQPEAGSRLLLLTAAPARGRVSPTAQLEGAR